MATAQEATPDPVDEEAERVFADPDVRASIEAFLAREKRGELGPGHTTEDVVKRLGLRPLDSDH